MCGLSLSPLQFRTSFKQTRERNKPEYQIRGISKQGLHVIWRRKEKVSVLGTKEIELLVEHSRSVLSTG